MTVPVKGFSALFQRAGGNVSACGEPDFAGARCGPRGAVRMVMHGLTDVSRTDEVWARATALRPVSNCATGVASLLRLRAAGAV